MLVSTLIGTILPVVVLAAPGLRERASSAATSDVIPAAALAVREGREAGLMARKLTTCAIVNVSSNVKCRYHANSKSEIITSFKNGVKNDYYCYASGECINGNW